MRGQKPDAKLSRRGQMMFLAPTAVVAGAMSHRARKKAGGPYRAVIPARITAAPLRLPAAVAAAAEDVITALDDFAARLGRRT